MKVQISRINIGSAFKVGAIVSGLAFLVFGIPSVLLQSLFLSSAFIMSSTAGQTSTQQFPEFSGLGAGLGIAGICVFVGIMSVVYAIFGGIGAAIMAFAYNLASGWVGGVEVDLERLASGEKAKNDG